MDPSGSKLSNNPRQNANTLSTVTFFYTLKIFIQGYKKELQENDLYEALEEHKSNYLGNKIEELWNIELKTSKADRRPSLKWVLFKMFGFKYLSFAFILIFSDVCVKLLQPLFLGHLISFYTNKDAEGIDQTLAYYYAGGVVLCSLLIVLLNHPYTMGVSHLGMKVRISVCSLIYRKVLRLNKASLKDTPVGQLVNLFSNDVSRFDYASVFINHIWVAPIQACVVAYLLYQKIGISAFVGVTCLAVFIPVQFALAKLSLKYRLRTATKTDERVRITNEVINGIQVIKMHTWEKVFEQLVSQARRAEIKSIRIASYIKAIYTSFLTFATRTALFTTIIAYVLLGNNINAQQMFIVTSYYDILRLSLTVFFPQGVNLIAEAIASMNRLNKFLLQDECNLGIVSSNKADDNNAVIIKNVTAKWIEVSSDLIFSNLNLKITRGALVAIVGPIGSGKTSLMHLILNELYLLNGKVDINGKISYASQEPWLFTSTVRQNIIFGEQMDGQRYKNVVKCCSLKHDFNVLSNGDNTIVGDKGVSLSGGQRARVNLARAIYKEADIYLLDDPFSAVDAHVGKELFKNCIKQLLRHKTVLLITHHLHYLKEVDQIVLIDDGKIMMQGNFIELLNSDLSFTKVFRSEQNVLEEELDILQRQPSSKRKMSEISNISMDLQITSFVKEQRSTGSIAGFVYKSYIKAAGSFCVIFMLLLILILKQLVSTMADYFIAFWVNMKQTDVEYFTTDEAIFIYLAITLGIIVLTISRSIFFFMVCINASKKLHNGMFDSILTTYLHFFNVNSSGRILNRFSKDMGIIDEMLPNAIIECTQVGLGLVAIIIVVSTVNYWMIIPTIVMCVLFIYIRKFYMNTCRTIKRLEGVTRSPIFTHVSATLQGLSTIRGFKAQEILNKEFDKHQDLHSSAWYIFLSTSTAFGYWLELISVFYIAIVILSFLLYGKEQYGGNVGLAITQSLVLTGALQWFMKQTSELETQMTSVERLLEFTMLESERALDKSNNESPKAWPQNGSIRFLNLCLKYYPEDPPVLKNLNFSVKPLEKIGIVGRTGAGKSSLITALFRLAQIDGAVIIDEVDTKSLNLYDLRSKISIIPQEPVLFSGTLRYNLDPFNEFVDNVLWQALEDVKLKKTICDMPLGLCGRISEGGANFSVGQRQLLCLARAILQKNKILVLDEATSNIDLQTDSIIQQTIRKKFAKCTVLTIAHRLNTIMDSDKIIVMDGGRIVEFGHPCVLLEKQGYFYHMLKQSGKNMIDSLTKIADVSYVQTLKN